MFILAPGNDELCSIRPDGVLLLAIIVVHNRITQLALFFWQGVMGNHTKSPPAPHPSFFVAGMGFTLHCAIHTN